MLSLQFADRRMKRKKEAKSRAQTANNEAGNPSKKLLAPCTMRDAEMRRLIAFFWKTCPAIAVMRQRSSLAGQRQQHAPEKCLAQIDFVTVHLKWFGRLKRGFSR